MFGTIPTVLPADASTMVHVTILPVIYDSAAEIHIIPLRASEAGVTVVTSPARVLDLITYSSTDSDSSEDPSLPEHAPTTPATYVLLILPRHLEIFLTEVHLRGHHHWIHMRLLLLGGGAESSHSVTTHSPLPSTGLSRKRCWSLSTFVTSTTHTPGALSPVRADLLPPHKRIRGSPAALSPEDTIEESLEVGSEMKIDLDIRADIEANIAAEAVAAVEVDVRN
ncbi:hypothetical protein Tco_0097420 [Tanacetum coccineum]